MGNLQIKNVPEEVHEELRSRAAARRMTVRDYLLELIERDQAAPTLDEWIAGVEAAAPSRVSSTEIVELIRDGREERTARILAAVSRSR